jgi:hypothetical protein
VISASYDDNVFINCPFDYGYRRLFQAVMFGVHDCGLVARSALEVVDAAEVRIAKIQRIIAECRHSIHDLSRTGLDDRTGLPRMNMPFELGLFLGAKRYGTGPQRKKTCIILDRDERRFRDYLSDIAGQDVRAHNDDPANLIREVRNALATTRPPGVELPSGRFIAERFSIFERDMPRLCAELNLDPDDLGHRDLIRIITGWLLENAESE